MYKYNKLLVILLIIILFLGFFIFDKNRKSGTKVLKIISPIEFQIDLNGNKIFDIGETVCIPNIETFTSNLDISQSELQNKLKLSYEDSIKFGYLTDNFVENLLSDRVVKVKFTGEQSQNCRYADILVDNESYSKKLFISGFAFKNSIPDKKYDERLREAKKLDLVILNHKSDKYHKLNCEYGHTAHDAVIIPRKQVPNSSQPCKFCHLERNEQKHFPAVPSFPAVVSQGDIKMFLTDLTSVLKPNDNCNQLVCKEVLSKINSSQNSIDMALYGWDNVPEILDAFRKAKARGVKIRIAYDNSKISYYPDTQNLLEIADEKSGDGVKDLMHNKFMIIDGKYVITGSMNFSKTGFSGFNTNCVLSINSEEIANVYLEEFSQMINGKFHQNKSNFSHDTILLNDTKVTPLFSPKDKVIVNNIIPLINSSQKYVYIPAFILTHDRLANSLVDAKKRGIDVKIVIDATNAVATRSKVKFLRGEGVPVKIENYAGKVHSKTIIIDDKYLIVGSMNFTNSGENKNDENVLIIENSHLAHNYKNFFEYLWHKIPEKYLYQNISAEGKSSIGSCYDGIDNDYDGKIDMADEGCF